MDWDKPPADRRGWPSLNSVLRMTGPFVTWLSFQKKFELRIVPVSDTNVSEAGATLSWLIDLLIEFFSKVDETGIP